MFEWNFEANNHINIVELMFVETLRLHTIIDKEESRDMWKVRRKTKNKNILMNKCNNIATSSYFSYGAIHYYLRTQLFQLYPVRPTHNNNNNNHSHSHTHSNDNTPQTTVETTTEKKRKREKEHFHLSHCTHTTTRTLYTSTLFLWNCDVSTLLDFS